MLPEQLENKLNYIVEDIKNEKLGIDESKKTYHKYIAR